MPDTSGSHLYDDLLDLHLPVRHLSGRRTESLCGYQLYLRSRSKGSCWSRSRSWLFCNLVTMGKLAAPISYTLVQEAPVILELCWVQKLQLPSVRKHL